MAGEFMSVVYFTLETGYESDGFGLDHESEKVLKKVGALLASSIRKDDSAAVAGSSFFVVVLKNTNADQAMSVVRRIQDRITHMSDFENGGAFSVPAIGLAVFPSDCSDRVKPLAEAERSYQAARAEGPGKIHLSVC
jgi:diguanylate cyclase (GGDEF)-like protein